MTNIKKWFSHHLEDNAREGEQFPKYYWNPYLVGIGLGIVLLASFVIMGRGLGASGALSTTVSFIVKSISSEHATNNGFYSKYLGDGSISPFKDWFVFLIIGAFFGGFISGAISGRNKLMIEKGPNISNKKRLIFAFIGGTLMGFGAKMARGCTSGQGLTGGAMLSVGGWAFMLMVFIGGYATAYFVRRQWI